MPNKSALTEEMLACGPDCTCETGGDQMLCTIWGCHAIATTTSKDQMSINYGDPRCDLHAVHFTNESGHPHSCNCATCETSDLSEIAEL